MELSKLNPWDWFKNEEESATKNLPIDHERQSYSSLAPLHQEIDRLFESAFRGFGLPPIGLNKTLSGMSQNVIPLPQL